TVSPCTPSPIRASRTSSSLNGLMMAMTSFMARLQCVAVGFAGANAHAVLDRAHEDLAVADLSGFCRGPDHLDHPIGAVGRDRDLDLDLGQEIHRVFGTAIDLGVPLLSAVALHLAHRDAGDTEICQRLAHLVELERLDDGGDELHRSGP